MPSNERTENTFDAVRNAKDRAARHAELALTASNGQFEDGLALDVLAAFADGIFRRSTTSYRLAWALSYTDRRTDLKPHEQRLLEDAWKRVVELGEEQKWETMGS